MTWWPAARKRSAHVSQLLGVIQRPWMRTMGVLVVVFISISLWVSRRVILMFPEPDSLRLVYLDSRPNVLSTQEYSQNREICSQTRRSVALKARWHDGAQGETQ